MSKEKTNFKKCLTYKTDSGLGGIFKLKFQGILEGKYTFKNISLGFETWTLSYSLEEAEQKIKPYKNN